VLVGSIAPVWTLVRIAAIKAAPLRCSRMRAIAISMAALCACSPHSVGLTPSERVNVILPDESAAVEFQIYPSIDGEHYKLTVRTSLGTITRDLWDNWGPATSANLYTTPESQVVVIGGGGSATVIQLSPTKLPARSPGAKAPASALAGGGTSAHGTAASTAIASSAPGSARSASTCSGPAQPRSGRRITLHVAASPRRSGEPDLGLMILGFGAAGAMARRRRHRAFAVSSSIPAQRRPTALIGASRTLIP